MSTSIDMEFNNCVNLVNNFKSGTEISVPDNVILDFYKFYKQATIGDCNTQKPGIFDFRENAKWTAWNSIKGMSQLDAKTNYIDLYNSII